MERIIWITTYQARSAVLSDMQGGGGGGAVWNIILISRGREDNRLTNKLITTEITDKECAANSSPLISSLLEITKTVALSPCFCVSQG